MHVELSIFMECEPYTHLNKYVCGGRGYLLPTKVIEKLMFDSDSEMFDGVCYKPFKFE